MKGDEALVAVVAEYKHATEIHGAFNTAHEGYAVVLEELDELWDEIKKKQSERDMVKLRAEAIQVAAMGLRFVVDCT